MACYDCYECDKVNICKYNDQYDCCYKEYIDCTDEELDILEKVILRLAEIKELLSSTETLKESKVLSDINMIINVYELTPNGIKEFKSMFEKIDGIYSDIF